MMARSAMAAPARPSGADAGAGAAPSEFICAINGHVMREPVASPDDVVFERETIFLWLSTQVTAKAGACFGACGSFLRSHRVSASVWPPLTPSGARHSQGSVCPITHRPLTRDALRALPELRRRILAWQLRKATAAHPDGAADAAAAAVAARDDDDDAARSGVGRAARGSKADDAEDTMLYDF
jgi:hypothetical protein